AAAPIPAPTPAAPTITLRSDRTTLGRGESATLTVITQNATNVTIEPDLGTVSPNGSRQVMPLASVTYIATAIGPGGRAGDNVRITVNNPPPPAETPRPAPPPATPTPSPTLDQQIERAMQTILFDYDKADVRPDQSGKLDMAAAFLKQNPNLRFTV